MAGWQIENAVTLVCATALVLGLYAMSHSFYSIWGLLLLANLNSIKVVK